MLLREVTIGRSKDCDIYLDPRCQYASKYHGTIFYDGQQLMYKDTSTNGTMINNVSVKHRSVPIRRGDIIMLAGKYQVNWNQIDAFFPSAVAQPPHYSGTVSDETSPVSESEPGPDLSKWSWGAFMLYPLWGFFNGCWWAILVFFFFGWAIIPAFIFGIYGYSLAWENRRWNSVIDFEETQHSWDMWGIAIFILNVIVLSFVLFAFWGVLISL